MMYVSVRGFLFLYAIIFLVFVEGKKDQEDNTITTECDDESIELIVPDFRYIAWNKLPDVSKGIASTQLKYDEESWNNLFTNEIEYLSFDSLKNSEQQGAMDIGFPTDYCKAEYSWDCYINHYDYYDWEELVLYDIDILYKVLGWTEKLWDKGGEPTSNSKYWHELSIDEKIAAVELCYIPETWNEVPLTEWATQDSRPSSKPSDSPTISLSPTISNSPSTSHSPSDRPTVSLSPSISSSPSTSQYPSTFPSDTPSSFPSTNPTTSSRRHRLRQMA